MSDARLADVPEDILADIYYLVAKDCFKQEDGFKRWCKLAGALPRLPTFLLPRVPLKQLAQHTLPWEGRYCQVLCRASTSNQKARCGSLLKLGSPGLLATCASLRCAGLKWALLRQPSASLLHIAVQKRGDRVGVLETGCVHTWRKPIQEEQEEGVDEVEAVMEVSEDKQGFRSLV